MSYTLRDVLEKLQELDDENLDKTAKIYLSLSNQFVEIFDIWVSADDLDEVEENHPVIEVEF